MENMDSKAALYRIRARMQTIDTKLGELVEGLTSIKHHFHEFSRELSNLELAMKQKSKE